MRTPIVAFLIAGLFIGCGDFLKRNAKVKKVDPVQLSGQSVRYVEGLQGAPASNRPITNEEYLSIIVASGFFRLENDETAKQIIREILNSKVIVEINSPSDNGGFSFIKEAGNDLTSQGTGFLRLANLPLFEQKYLNLPSLRISMRFYASSKEGIDKINQTLGIIKELEKSPQYQTMASLYHVGLRLLNIDIEKPLIQLDFAMSLANPNLENATCDGAPDVLCEGYLLLTEANATSRPPQNAKFGPEGLCTPQGNDCVPWRDGTYLVLKVKRHAVPGAGEAEKDIRTIDTELLNAADQIRQPNMDLIESTIFGLGDKVSAPHVRLLRGLYSLAKWEIDYSKLQQIYGDQWVSVKSDLMDAIKRYKLVQSSMLLTGDEKDFLRSVCSDFTKIQGLLVGINEGLRPGELPECPK